MGDKAAQADRIARPAAEIERLAREVADTVEDGTVGAHRVIHMQDVAHLVPIAIDGDRLALQRTDEEMGNPALVFGSELPLAVDAAHAQHRRRHLIAAGIIEHILVGRALRAAVRRVKFDWPALADP
jgi:hypothetical protein